MGNFAVLAVRNSLEWKATKLIFSEQLLPAFDRAVADGMAKLYARTPTPKYPFTTLPADVWPFLRVTDWEEGCARDAGYWSIHAKLLVQGSLATSRSRLNPSFAKIKEAVDAEVGDNGRIDGLRPSERNKRLADRMKRLGYRPEEIPSERTFREYFNKGPGKPEKSS